MRQEQAGVVEIELFDGTVLEFPEGTEQAVLDRVAQQETAYRAQQGSRGTEVSEADQAALDRYYEANPDANPGARIGTAEEGRGGTYDARARAIIAPTEGLDRSMAERFMDNVRDAYGRSGAGNMERMTDRDMDGISLSDIFQGPEVYEGGLADRLLDGVLGEDRGFLPGRSREEIGGAAAVAERTRRANYDARAKADPVSNIGDFLAAAGGQLGVGAVMPENWAGGGGSTILRRIAGNAAANFALDGVLQGSDAATGVQDGYNAEQGAMAAVVGGALPAGFEGAGFVARQVMRLVPGWKASPTPRGVDPAMHAEAEAAELVAANPDLEAALAANGVTADDPRAAVLADRLNARRAREAAAADVPSAIQAAIRGETGALEAAVEGPNLPPQTRSDIQAALLGDIDPAHIRAPQGRIADEGITVTGPDGVTYDVPREPIPVGPRGADVGDQALDLAMRQNTPALEYRPGPAPRAMSDEQIAQAQRTQSAGRPNPVVDEGRLTAPEGRAPQTRDGIQGEREAAGAFDLAQRQRDRLPEATRDTQAAGMPRGPEPEAVLLNDGFPVRIVGNRGNRVVVERYDPRTGQAEAGSVPYEVRPFDLEERAYQADPRMAQDFGARDSDPRTTPERPRMAGEPVRRDPTQTYQATAPDDGPAGAGRAPLPEQPEGPSPFRDQPRGERAQRAADEEELRQRYERAQREDAYRRAYEANGANRQAGEKSSNKEAEPDAEGRFTTNDAGFVRSAGGGPIIFDDQKMAARWIIKIGHARSPDQIFELANHPTSKGRFTVLERGRANAGAAADDVSSGGVGGAAPARPGSGESNAGTEAPALAGPARQEPVASPDAVRDAAPDDLRAQDARDADFDEVDAPAAPAWNRAADGATPDDVARAFPDGEARLDLDAMERTFERNGEQPASLRDALTRDVELTKADLADVDPRTPESMVQASRDYLARQEGRLAALEPAPVSRETPTQPSTRPRVRIIGDKITASAQAFVDRVDAAVPEGYFLQAFPEGGSWKTPSVDIWPSNAKTREGVIHLGPNDDLSELARLPANGTWEQAFDALGRERTLRTFDAAGNEVKRGEFDLVEPKISETTQGFKVSLGYRDLGRAATLDEAVGLARTGQIEHLRRGIEGAEARLAEHRAEVAADARDGKRISGNIANAERSLEQDRAKLAELEGQGRVAPEPGSERTVTIDEMAAEGRRQSEGTARPSEEPEPAPQPTRDATTDADDLSIPEPPARTADGRIDAAQIVTGAGEKPKTAAAAKKLAAQQLDELELHARSLAQNDPDVRAHYAARDKAYGDGTTRPMSEPDRRDWRANNPFPVSYRWEMPNASGRSSTFNLHADADQIAAFKRRVTGPMNRTPDTGRGSTRGLTPIDNLRPEQQQQLFDTNREVSNLPDQPAKGPSDPIPNRNGRMGRFYSGLDPEAVVEDLVKPAIRGARRLLADAGPSTRALRAALAESDAAAKAGDAARAAGVVGRTLGMTNAAALNMIASKYKGVPAMRQIADMVATDPGTDRVIGQTFQRAVEMRAGGMANRLVNIVGTKVDPAVEREAQAILAGRQQARPGSEAGKMARRIRALLDEHHAYLKAAGLDVGYVSTGYFPRVLDLAKIEADPAAFKKAAATAYRRAGMDARDAEFAAGAWHQRVFGVQTGSFEHGAPTTNSTRGRVLGKDADRILADFYQTDVRSTLLDYFNQTSRAAEFTRRFGKGGEKLDRLFDEAERGGVNGRDIALMRAHVNSAAGLFRPDVPGTGALALIQTGGVLALLGRATISSVAEGLSVGVRAHDVSKGVTAMVDGWREALGVGRDDELKEAAHMLGIVGDAVNDLIVSASFGGDIGGKGQQKALSLFFRANGLHQITQGQRVAAFRVGHGFLTQMLREATTAHPRQRSASRLLNELGVSAADAPKLAAWLNRADDTGRMRSVPLAELTGEKAEAQLYRTALQRFVDESIQNPSAADKPLWANHPYGKLAYGITSFMFAFTRNVLNRTAHTSAEAFGKGYTLQDRARLLAPALSLGVLAAAQMVVSEQRDRLMSRDAYDQRTDFQQAVTNMSRAGVFGSLDPLVNMAASARYDRDLSSTFTGPYLTFYLDAASDMTLGLLPSDGDWAVGKNSPNTENAEHRATRSAYQAIIAPLLNLGLSVGANAAPGGVAGKAVKAAALGGIVQGSSGSASSSFADLFFERSHVSRKRQDADDVNADEGG